MKTYSDLQDIDTRLNLVIQLELVGSPKFQLLINDKEYDSTAISQSIIQDYLPLMDPIKIDIILSEKHYTTEYETAVIIKQLSIDNINLIPQYDYLAKYDNDHRFNNPTSYVGFNGKWTLTIDQPFYHWLHEHSGQGWLIG